MAILYHYTTASALLGMLKDYTVENPNLSMWATHYMFMNDRYEYEIGCDYCRNLIKKVEDELNIENRISDNFGECNFETIIREAQREYATETDVFSINNPYIISFSENKDGLNMWNMYAQNGNGISIGFDEELLRRNSIAADKCRYNLIIDKEAIDDGIKVYDHISKMIVNMDDNNLFKTFIITNYFNMMIGSVIKHTSFNIEKEYRTLAVDADKIHFREKDGLIIPFIIQKIPFECVNHIILGPTSDFYRLRESILMFLQSKGIKWDEDKIIMSEVPYKG